jgi:acyl carrier protein
MTKEEIKAAVIEVFQDVLDEDDLGITEASTAQDVEDWDSLTHVQIVVGVEKRFKVRFASQEIAAFENVGDMINAIEKKI